MTPKDNILAELRDLSPLLASVPKVNVFTVPDSYFETLGLHLLVGSDESDMVAKTLSTVPEGYFENLSSIILDRIKGSEVLKETMEISSIVAGIGNKNLFEVPARYFEDLPATILLASTQNTAGSILGENLTNVSRENLYKVPSGYFDHLSADILARIKNDSTSEVAAETVAISKLVAGIGNRNVYSVPQEYFGNMAGQVLSETIKPLGKVVSMKGRFTALKYAAAAAITGILGLSLFFMLNKNEPQKNTTTATMIAAKEIIKTNSFENELNSISDEAIVNFLEAKGEDVEAALVASLVDEKNLPDATDYLIDDNTLDDILKTVELSN